MYTPNVLEKDVTSHFLAKQRLCINPNLFPFKNLSELSSPSQSVYVYRRWGWLLGYQLNTVSNKLKLPQASSVRYLKKLGGI